MPADPEDYPNHQRAEGLDDIHFDGFDDMAKVIIAAPANYFPVSDIPPPEVQEVMNRLRERLKDRGIEPTAVRIDLREFAHCAVCDQEVIVNRPAYPGDGIPRICWDCIEEQHPGFIDEIKAKYAQEEP